MNISLYEIFERFCGATEGHLNWSEERRIWSDFVLTWFDEYAQSKGLAKGQRNYMGVDSVWRDPTLDHIALALEHENEGRAKEFLSQEIRHLVDLKSMSKVAITYPHAGEERETIKAVKDMISRGAMLASDVFGESYLVLFGFDTRREGKRAILWRGHLISGKGNIEERETVVLQKL